MKKYILLALVTFACNALLISCGGGGSDDGGGSSGGGSGGTTPRTYTQSITIDANSYSQTIKLTELKTNIVSATSSQSWVTLTRNSYTSSSPSITIDVSENISTSSRMCDITVTASDGNVVIIHLTQQGITTTANPEKKNEYSDQEPYSLPSYFE